jgi:hypothetical protein
MHVGTVEQRQPLETLMADSMKRSALILFQAWQVMLTPLPAWAGEAAASRLKEPAEHTQSQGARMTATAPSDMPGGHHCFDNPKVPRRSPSSKKPKMITTAQPAQ